MHGYPLKKAEILTKRSGCGPDPEGYAGFNFQSCHGTLVVWAPEHPLSLIEAAKWTKSIAKFANSRIPCVLVAFDSANVEWMGKGKTIESEAALEQLTVLP